MRANRRYLIIFAGLIFVVAAWITLKQNVGYNHQEITAKTEVAAKKETHPRSSSRLLDKKADLSNRAKIKSLPGTKIKDPVPAKKQARILSNPVYKSGDTSSDALNKEASLTKQAEKGTITGKGGKKQEQYEKPEQFASVPVKQSSETGIQIQAIAWSEDSGARLAVINGLILREGESIDNVKVVHIGKDAVVFEKNGEEWKQMFGF
ncbi:MAG: general secretion pathway protein GspB [Desulfobacterales bacterium]